MFEPDPVEGATATDEDLLAGLDWIADACKSRHASDPSRQHEPWPPKTPDDENPNHPLHLAVKALYDMGISVVVAAGNDPTRK